MSAPKYIDMIVEAIKTLKVRGGASRIAIQKYILANFKPNLNAFATAFRMALRRGVTNGKGQGCAIWETCPCTLRKRHAPVHPPTPTDRSRPVFQKPWCRSSRASRSTPISR